MIEQDQILKTKTKIRTTRPRPRSKPEWRDQDQDQNRAFVPRLFVQYAYFSSSKQIPFSVFKRLLYLTYSRFDITVLTASTYNGTACMFSDNKYATHFATHKNAQSQLVTVQCSLSANQNVKDLARNIKYSHSHKILVALQHHKLTQYSVSWHSPMRMRE